MIKVIVIIVQLVLIHQKMVGNVRLDAMMTIRLFKRMGNAKHARFTLSQTQILKREVASQINATLRISISS